MKRSQASERATCVSPEMPYFRYSRELLSRWKAALPEARRASRRETGGVGGILLDPGRDAVAQGIRLAGLRYEGVEVVLNDGV